MLGKQQLKHRLPDKPKEQESKGFRVLFCLGFFFEQVYHFLSFLHFGLISCCVTHFQSIQKSCHPEFLLRSFQITVVGACLGFFGGRGVCNHNHTQLIQKSEFLSVAMQSVQDLPKNQVLANKECQARVVNKLPARLLSCEKCVVHSSCATFFLFLVIFYYIVYFKFSCHSSHTVPS